MGERKRIHRQDPARTGPIRNFSNLYRRFDVPYDSRQTGYRKVAEAASPSGIDNNPVSQAVELGYQIIETYLQTGRQAAGQFNDRAYSMRPTNDKVPDLLSRIARSYGEMLPIWLELAGSLVKVDRPPTSVPPPSDVRTTTNGIPNNGSKGVALEVVSRRPVRVSLELREPPNGVALTTHGLRAIDPDKPPLTDVSFLPGGNNGCSSLRIAIPDGHPSGVYSGVIVDCETGESRGTLSIRIAD